MSDTAYPLHTERLTLRMMREDDIDALTAYRNDPQVFALQDWDLPYPRERAERLVAAHADRDDVQPGTGTQLAIELDRALIGDIYVGLDEHCGIADIGFSLAVQHQGKGYAGEAASAVVDDLVERLAVHRIVAELSPDNHASARLLERLGMSFEYFAEMSFWWRGAWDDNLHYSVTADQRRAWRGRPLTPPEQVQLVELDHDNVWGYRRLRTHRSQETFVATMDQSFVDAFFPEPEEGHPVVAGWAQGQSGPEPFYLKAGFVLTGEMDDGEAVARLEL